MSAERPEARKERSSEVAALVTLLAEDDAEIHARVRDRLAQIGEDARPELQGAADDSDPRRRSRARRLLQDLDQARALANLTRFVDRGELDLEESLWELSRPSVIDSEIEAAKARLAEWSGEVRALLGEDTSAFDRPLALVDVLAKEHGLEGPERNYHNPDHIHLPRVIERGRGLPLSLTAVYLIVARRVGLRCAPVALPGHVLLRIYAGERSMLVDPFDRGAVRTRKECIQYLMRRGLAIRPDWFEDASDVQIFQRQILNLANSHRLGGRRAEADQLMSLAGRVASRRGLHPAADPESA